MPLREHAQLEFGEATIPYRLTRSRKRRRTIEIAIDATGHVSVAAPVWTAQQEIDDFVRRKAAWIRRQIASSPVAPSPQEERSFATGERLPFLGRELTLTVIDDPGVERGRVRLAGEQIEVRLPLDVQQADRNAAVRSVLERWYRRRARAVFEERVAVYAPLVRVSPKRVLVRAQKTRWGSCGSDGTLRLNWHLMLAPMAIVDYIVVHELCHLRRGGHGKAFWQLVERVLPEYKVAKAELRRAGRTYRF